MYLNLGMSKCFLSLSKMLFSRSIVPCKPKMAVFNGRKLLITRQSFDSSGFLPVKGEIVTFQTWLDKSMVLHSWDQGAKLT